MADQQHEQPDPLSLLLASDKEPQYPVSDDPEVRLLAFQNHVKTLDRQMSAELGSPTLPHPPINREVDAGLIKWAGLLADLTRRDDVRVCLNQLQTIKRNEQLYPAWQLGFDHDPYRAQLDRLFEILGESVRLAKAVLELKDRLVDSLNTEVQSNR